MATAFQSWLVIMIDWELLGNVARDHDDAWSQFPLIGLIQEFTCAETEVDMVIITNPKKHTARVIPKV